MPEPADVTDAELAVLEVLWARERATVRELTDELYPDGGASSYGTVQKLLQRLEGKRCVRRANRTVPHVYAARVARDAIVDLRLEELVDKLCAGSLLPILSHVARRRRLTAQQREELRQFVDELAAREDRRRPR